ncbi:hypothetical protein BOTBODRAFT_129916 [Botryobasidium botryosum FD-172 SS1]|uniref:NADPH--cytochrome P450 reductase n=1 Tax=Botryobasidium botryosum (strain FD-172 SS1) TaxID=930990 RepID=A0A067MLY9_BOTB1|nr:hypothetical protein BOTBODRAFT_129916 [Botryobasidium botryosum FD-172 SS1]
MADAHDPIPSPPAIPFLGNIRDIENEVPLRSLHLLAQRFGPIYQLNMLGQPAVFLSSQELVDEACDEKRFHKTISGGLLQVRNVTGDGLFTAFHGEHSWGVAHRILMPAFGPVMIRNMFPDMLDICSQLILKWERFGPEHVIDPTDDFTRLTLDTVALCVMNYRFNSFYKEANHPFVEAMGRYLTESGSRSRRPQLVQAMMRSATARYEADYKTMMDTCDEIVATRKSHPIDKKDLLNLMLLGKDAKTGEGLSEMNIKYQMITFVIAGHETSSGLLSFVMYYLLKNPEAYAKVREEVDSVLGNTPITADLVSKLPYIVAVMRETLRLSPSAPIFSVTPFEDEVIGTKGGKKYLIKKDTPVSIMVYDLHRDPAVWGPDAEDFKPERMLDSEFEKLPKNAWKPFGNGMRACIGRPFAWAEVIIVIASIFQKFDFVMQDSSYTLALKQSLTIKPNNFRFRAIPRERAPAFHIVPGMTAASRSGDNAASAAVPTNAQTGEAASSGDTKTLYCYYGSNTGSCESFAQRIASEAPSKGFRAHIGTLDSVIGSVPVPKDGPVVVVTASYEGLPADNAAFFMQKLGALKGRELEGINYALFGCGNTDWTHTYQAVPKLCDALFQEHGAMPLLERGEGNAASSNFIDQFDAWEAKLWKELAKVYSLTEKKETAGLVVEKTGVDRSVILRHTDTALGQVVENHILTKPGIAAKRHIELVLPPDMSYRAGDYLAIIPTNPKDTVRRAVARFGFLPEQQITLHSPGPTSLPVDVPISVNELLSGYVELAHPATKRNLQDLIDTVPENTTDRTAIEGLLSDYQAAVLDKRLSILDILELHPNVPLPFSTFLTMLPAMRIRQYSISSSPLWNPEHVTLTISVLEAPALSGHGTFRGVATSFLAQLEPGDKVQLAVRPSQAAFHLPSDPEVPIVMFCAGAGFAPMRGFIQERARQITAGRKVGKALLFVGCRKENEDFLYKDDDLAEWVKVGAVDVRPAFSREPEKSKGCKYIQHRIWHDRADLAEISRAGAKFYVCGSSAISNSVKETSINIIAESQGCTAEEAEVIFQEKIKERFAADVFG